MTIMVNSRNKGKAFELFLCKVLRVPFKNIATSRLMSKATDDAGVDFVNTGDWAIQAKRYARKYPNLEEALDMDTDAKHRCVIHKRDRKQVLVTMSLEDFIKILHKTKSE